MFARRSQIVLQGLAKRASALPKVAARVAVAAPMRMQVAAYSVAPICRSPLTDLLRTEIDHEETNKENDIEYEDVKKIVLKSFTISEQPGYGEVILRRTHGDEKIEVFFHVQGIDDDGMDFSEDEQEGADDETPNVGVNFRVEITKGTTKVQIDAVGGQELDVHSVRILPVDANPAEEGKFYNGPEFGELEDDLQEAFLDYLEERKIDGDLAYFILSHSRTKEQSEYVNWLKNLERFTSSK